MGRDPAVPVTMLYLLGRLKTAEALAGKWLWADDDCDGLGGRRDALGGTERREVGREVG